MRTEKQLFFRTLSRLMQVFWIAAVCDAAYILRYVCGFLAAPSAAMARGASLSLVPAMTEHILMGAVLLLLCGTAAELLRRRL